MQENIEARVKKAIAEQLGLDIPHVLDNSDIYNDLGADSLDAVELVMAIEDEFRFEIPDEVAWDLTTVRNLVGYVTANVKA